MVLRYIRYIWFGLVWILWHINHCRLFNAKSSLYICIKYIGFGLFWFYSIKTIVGYLMLNPLYIYIYIYIYIYRIWFGWVLWFLWHINHTRLFNAKSSLYIYIEYTRFGWVVWHINHCRLFNAKSSLCIYIKYIGFVNTFPW